MANGRYSYIAELQDAKELIKEVMDQLKEKLPAFCGLRVNSVTLGGSLGLDICHTRYFDCNIVIYSADIDPKEMVKHGTTFWLQKVDQLFQQDELLRTWYGCQQEMDHMLCFTLQDLVEVRLFLSPWWGPPNQFYTFMETVIPQDRSKFYICGTKWQMQFLKHQPHQDQRKELTRRAMAWRDRHWIPSSACRGRPSTYLLTLLLLRAYENALKTVGVFSTLCPDSMAHYTTETLKKIVSNHKTIDIWWEHCYSLKQYPKLISPPPRILDPANPDNNLYITGVTPYAYDETKARRYVRDGHWTALKMHIDSLDLSKPIT